MRAWSAFFVPAFGKEGAKLASLIMTRILIHLTIAGVLAMLIVGCGGGDKEKGINSNKDRPKAADKGE